METTELIESKKVLIQIIESFNNEGKGFLNSTDLKDLGCYEYTLLNPFLKELGYMDKDGKMIKKYPNPSESPYHLREWVNERRKKNKNNGSDWDHYSSKGKDDPLFKLISVINGINASKKLKYNYTELSKHEVKYAACLRPFLLDKGYININNRLIKPIDNVEKIDESIREWVKVYYPRNTKNKAQLYPKQLRLKVEEQVARLDISLFSDEELVKELRRREYKVTAEKNIKLVL